MERQARKEKNVLDETKQDGDGVYINKDGCIWVCTQLVEASLDIDFDYLFTEAATADSLIQRMGRVWRHRKKDYKGDENIIIATDVEYKVYEKILVEKSVELIQEAIIENSNYLYSKNKREIVKILYSEEKLTEWGSKYLDEWKKFENAINSGWNFILEENAQKAFRDVMTIELIPSNFKDEVIDIYNSFKDFINQINSDANISDRGKKTQKRLEKLKKLKSIQEYKVPVPIYLVNPNVSSKKINCSKPIEWLDKDYAIGFLHENYEYNKVLGLTGKSLALEEDNILQKPYGWNESKLLDFLYITMNKEIEIDLDSLKTNGIKLNYLYVCERKLWLFDRGIQMEQNSDKVLMGKLLEENSYPKENKKRY